MSDQSIAGGRRLLTIHDLQALFRCGRTAAYARVHETDFPVPVALSDSAHRWWEHEVLDWIEAHRQVQRTARQRGTAPHGQTAATSTAEIRPTPTTIHRRTTQR